MIMPIRLIRGIEQHFPTRVNEWALATALTLWGVRLLQPDDVFITFGSFRSLAVYMSEEAWGGACIIIGLLRITALMVNGTLADMPTLRESKFWLARLGVWYSRYSPHVRAVLALLSCFFWFTIAFGFLTSDPVGPGALSVYPILFLLDLWSATRASIDADRVNRHVSNGSQGQH